MEDDFSGREHRLLENFGMREVSCHALEEVFYALVFFSSGILDILCSIYFYTETLFNFLKVAQS